MTLRLTKVIVGAITREWRPILTVLVAATLIGGGVFAGSLLNWAAPVRVAATGAVSTAASTPPPTTVTSVSGTQGLMDVACMTPTNCVAVGAVPQVNNPSLGAIVPIINGVPGAPITVASANYLAGVACISSTSCVAVGQNEFANSGFGGGVVVPITSGAPGAAQTLSSNGGLVGVACSSSGSCWGVGWSEDGNGVINGATVVPISNGSPGAPVTVGSTDDELYRIACATDSSTASTNCLAVGGNGANAGNSQSNAGMVVPITNGTVGAAQSVSGVGWLNGVACTSTTSCVADGEASYPGTQGVVIPITSGVPGPVQTTTFLSGRGYGGITAAGTGGVACASASDCLAAGQGPGPSPTGEWLAIANGVPGSTQSVSGTTDLTSVTFTGNGYLGVGNAGPATAPADVVVYSASALPPGMWQAGTSDVSGGV